MENKCLYTSEFLRALESEWETWYGGAGNTQKEAGENDSCRWVTFP